MLRSQPSIMLVRLWSRPQGREKKIVLGFKNRYLLTKLMIPFFFSRASISRDPFYDMLATRKRRIANKK